MVELSLVIGLLLGLAVKHFICDFTLQNMWMVLDKGFYGKPGGIAHAAIHGIGTFLVVLTFLSGTLPIHVLIFLGVFDAFLHYHIDWLKMSLNRRLALSYNNRLYWVFLGADQLLHWLGYILILFIALR